ncbi:MAG TPA: methyltransferase domain-containing protein [Polyangiales bacterium]|nr:methyltransferase domain-containing protein [Polyangiales bacterium]
MPSDNPAETYESYMVPVLFTPWADRLLAAAGLRAGERVLDVACGTGAVARRAAALLGRDADVTAVDLSADMLEVARAAAAREGLGIDFHQGRAESLPFADHGFDLVTCQFALMFFSDRTAALRELRRVAKPGGRIALAVFAGLERHPFYQRLHEVIEQRLGISALQQIFSLGAPGALRDLLDAAGYSSLQIEAQAMTAHFPDPDAFLAGEIAVDTAAIPAMQQLDAAARRRATEAIATDMAAPLRERVRDGHVELEFHVLVACV